MQTMQALHLGGLMDPSADIMPEIKPRVQPARAFHVRFKREVYEMEDGSSTLKMRLLKAEVNKAQLYAYMWLGLSARSTSLSSERHTATSSKG